VATSATAELLALIDEAATPLADRHAAELAELTAEAKDYGQRPASTKQLDDQHKRELRRHRTDELRSGLATIAATYRDAAINEHTTDRQACVDAVHRIHLALEALERNPNERLLLESLLWSLPDAQGVR
jgi:DNA polymerase-3 subunit delta'